MQFGSSPRSLWQLSLQLPRTPATHTTAHWRLIAACHLEGVFLPEAKEKQGSPSSADLSFYRFSSAAVISIQVLPLWFILKKNLAVLSSPHKMTFCRDAFIFSAIWRNYLWWSVIRNRKIEISQHYLPESNLDAKFDDPGKNINPNGWKWMP